MAKNMTSVTTRSTITASFPHVELTRIEGAPSYLSLQKLKSELVANTISVHSIRSNGQLGHAVLVLGPTEYNRIANLPNGGNANNWDPPVHPGAEPNIPNNTAKFQIARITSAYDRNLKEFTTYTNTANILKQQVLAAIDPTYLCSLQDPLYGYSNVTVAAILQHLDDTYGALDQTELNKNMATLDVPWEPTESMEPLHWLGFEKRALYLRNHQFFGAHVLCWIWLSSETRIQLGVELYHPQHGWIHRIRVGVAAGKFCVTIHSCLLLAVFAGICLFRRLNPADVKLWWKGAKMRSIIRWIGAS